MVKVWSLTILQETPPPGQSMVPYSDFFQNFVLAYSTPNGLKWILNSSPTFHNLLKIENRSHTTWRAAHYYEAYHIIIHCYIECGPNPTTFNSLEVIVALEGPVPALGPPVPLTPKFHTSIALVWEECLIYCCNLYCLLILYIDLHKKCCLSFIDSHILELKTNQNKKYQI